LYSLEVSGVLLCWDIANSVYLVFRRLRIQPGVTLVAGYLSTAANLRSGGWTVMTDPNRQVPARNSNNPPHPSFSFGGGIDQPSSQAQQLSSASSYADLNFLFGVQDPAMLVPKPNRNRRKSSQGSDHTKHRRTRSGCYTCRSRRVKVGWSMFPITRPLAYQI
jgi:hypothetical protein